MNPLLLSPLPVCDEKFQALSLDFFVDLPLSQGFNLLLAVVDWLTKYGTFLPCAFGPDHPFGARGMADMLVHHIVRKHSVPWSIVHDQDT